MIERILPPEAAWAEAFGDTETGDLHPREQAGIARAVASRRREFGTGRLCARRALRRLGVEPAALEPDDHGAPGWPPGVRGSITHCQGYRACAVVAGDGLSSIGIDAEPDLPVPRGMLPMVALPAERRALRELTAGHPGVCWDRLLFSAKEAVYKAWYPLTGKLISFEHAEVAFDPGAGTFTVRMLATAPPGRRAPEFGGRWLAAGGLLLTCAVPL